MVAAVVAQPYTSNASADAHVKLMTGYTRVLGEAEQLGRTRPLPPRERRWPLRLVVDGGFSARSGSPWSSASPSSSPSSWTYGGRVSGADGPSPRVAGGVRPRPAGWL